MANKKADLGIGNYMQQIKSNKPKAEKEVPVFLENNEDNLQENTVSESSKGEKVVEDPSQTIKKNDNAPETLFRNIVLTPETLFRLEAVRKLQKNTAQKGKRVSLGLFMGAIIEEYLDEKYPQTKELYKLMEGMQ